MGRFLLARRGRVFALGAIAAILCGAAITSLALASADEKIMAPGTASATPPTGMNGVVMPQPVNMPSDPAQAAMVSRGLYLTVAGDCVSCHTVAGAPPFSGGYAVDSPFGTIFSPNITPSKQTGIGNWTDQQFYAALHNGVRPGSSLLVFPAYLFPVMPYTTYSKLTYPDVMAIKAYLDSLAPVENANRPMTIGFPFNVRAAQLTWRLLFFRAMPMQYEADWSPSVRNGAYIVQALAHCSECHTPRNMLMASENGSYLAGGKITSQSWYAPNISSSKQYGIGAWDDASLVQYLHNDGDNTRGAPFGPMKETVDNSLSRLPASDIQDIVNFLRTTAPQDSPMTVPADAASLAFGAQVYAENCARCHGVDGAGVANNFPNLAHNEGISEGNPDDAISMVLGGAQPWHSNQSAMPAFGNTLSETQIAAVTNYIRTAWGNAGVADATADDVARLKPATTQEVALDTGTMQAQLLSGGAVQNFADISGTFEYEGNRDNCQIDANFTPDSNSATPAQNFHIGGGCAADGNSITGLLSMAGQTTPVTLALRDITTGNAVTGVTLDGKLTNGTQLHAQISFTTPND